ncbi:MAG: bifunctional methylenetetrahydrofolate dehydrogenase/methenyltetrahydrofolate cyclohydrolase FolD, partial [Deltaproteobacteria bacterium]|nr:bifunctional methylenetetrahydrofolate dehydrogenase/methenyltetrahydrofolate cyclohydrolase FolD [Deltaproteobacteria bacterium]
AEISVKQIKPGLAVIIVGEDPASHVYVKRKHKACQKVGIYSEVIHKDAQVTQEEIIALIQSLNGRQDIHGILVQLPLPKHLDENSILRCVDENKDVDGFHLINAGRLMRAEPGLHPCTPSGVIRLMKEYDIRMEGAHAVVIGRSNIVGKPMAHLLLAENATVTIAHSRTKDLASLCQHADIIVAAVGIPNMVKSTWVKDGTCLIDVGINRMPDGTLAGDIDFQEFENRNVSITPVPGGVGPLTIAMLLSNTLQAYSLQTQ